MDDEFRSVADKDNRFEDCENGALERCSESTGLFNPSRSGKSSCNCCGECAKQSWKTIAWRILNGIMAILFAAACAMQIVYIVPCLISILVAGWMRIQEFLIWKIITLLHILGCFGGMIYICVKYRNKISKASTNITSIEEGWELCGLLLVIVWLTIVSVVASYSTFKQFCKKTFSAEIGAEKSSGRVVFKQGSHFEPERIEY
eukprot:Seg70.3 transcript_id=Seg70.3/GoldUCD/mRNA.D3Y31 product="Transmembrane protein 220" protein_id=Seg70.3/GoldUCD/D3Y31